MPVKPNPSRPSTGWGLHTYGGQSAQWHGGFQQVYIHKGTDKDQPEWNVWPSGPCGEGNFGVYFYQDQKWPRPATVWQFYPNAAWSDPDKNVASTSGKCRAVVTEDDGYVYTWWADHVPVSTGCKIAVPEDAVWQPRPGAPGWNPEDYGESENRMYWPDWLAEMGGPQGSPTAGRWYLPAYCGIAGQPGGSSAQEMDAANEEKQQEISDSTVASPRIYVGHKAAPDAGLPPKLQKGHEHEPIFAANEYTQEWLPCPYGAAKPPYSYFAFSTGSYCNGHYYDCPNAAATVFDGAVPSLGCSPVNPCPGGECIRSVWDTTGHGRVQYKFLPDGTVRQRFQIMGIPRDISYMAAIVKNPDAALNPKGKWVDDPHSNGGYVFAYDDLVPKGAPDKVDGTSVDEMGRTTPWAEQPEQDKYPPEHYRYGGDVTAGGFGKAVETLLCKEDPETGECKIRWGAIAAAAIGLYVMTS